MERDRLEQYIEVIYNRCCRLLQDDELAKDALQECMLKFFEASTRQKIQQPLHYLYRSSTNHCINLLRKRKWNIPLDPEEFERQWGGNSSGAETKLVLEQLAEHLGEEAMKLLIYRHVDQMTYVEMGRLYNRSDRAIKKRLERIDRQIREWSNT